MTSLSKIPLCTFWKAVLVTNYRKISIWLSFIEDKAQNPIIVKSMRTVTLWRLGGKQNLTRTYLLTGVSGQKEEASSKMRM